MNITHPLPSDMDDFQFIIHAASIASPTYYRQYPIETMDANVNGLRSLFGILPAGKKRRVFPLKDSCSTPPVKFTVIRPPKIFPPQKPIAAMYPVPAPAPATTNRSATAKPFALILPCSTTCRLKMARSLQQLRPWPENYRQTGVTRFRPRYFCRS